ncbi:MAG: hypothetical protein WCA84_06700 [Ignavibacteriaceae bacterium]
MKEQTEIDGKFVDKIISVAYGDGSLFDKIEVYKKAYSNPAVKKLLYDYKATAKAVKYAQKEYASAKPLSDVKSENNRRGNIFIPLLAGLYKAFVINWAYSAATVIVVITVSTFLLLRQPKPEPTYSKEQVILAEKQVKESFALVENMLAKAQNKTTPDLIRNNILRPIQKSTVIINNLLN